MSELKDGEVAIQKTLVMAIVNYMSDRPWKEVCQAMPELIKLVEEDKKIN